MICDPVSANRKAKMAKRGGKGKGKSPKGRGMNGSDENMDDGRSEGAWDSRSEFSDASSTFTADNGDLESTAFEDETDAGGSGAIGVDVYTDVEEKLAEAIELMEEKRASTRASGISKIVRILKRRVCDDGVLDKRRETLMSAIVGGLKHKPKSGEAVALCKLLSLAVITFGPGDGADVEFAEDVMPVLVRKAREFRKPEVAAAALRTLAMCAFVVSTEDADTEKCIDLFVEVFTGARQPAPFAAIIAALQAWGLLMTTMPLESAFVPNVPRFAAPRSRESRRARGSRRESCAFVRLEVEQAGCYVDRG